MPSSRQARRRLSADLRQGRDITRFIGVIANETAD